MGIAVNNNEKNIVASCWEMLRPLSAREKLELVSLLTTAVLEEENGEYAATKARRVATARRRYPSAPSDSELEARFTDKSSPEIPATEPTWRQVINANSGKTIKSVEKWL